jgi:serine/threonine-protein kinase HipA
MKLDVYVEDRPVGVLEQVALDKFVFSYLPHTDPSDAVSILMPVRTESYTTKAVHPFFQISLPEGAILNALTSRLARQKGGKVSEMDLLEAIGHNTIGRVRVIPAGHDLPTESEDHDVDFLLKQPPQFLAQWFLEERLLKSGVSGAFPKGFASEMVGPDQRGTLRTDTWIIKFDDTRVPSLSFNEHWSMEVARRAKLNTARTVLSEDMHALAVERFDRRPNQPALGFEDFCSLSGRPAVEKYAGSVERIIKDIKVMVRPERCAGELTAFFGAYVCCSTLRNNDAHTKNFGLLYVDPEDVRLAPIYDQVTASMYVPADSKGDSSDSMALSFTGTRKWLTADLILKLGDLCGQTKRQRNAVEHALSEAMVSVAQDLVKTDLASEFRAAAHRMVQLWSHGARVFDPKAADGLVDLAESLTPAAHAVDARATLSAMADVELESNPKFE